ncbi:MAG: glycosyltransferase [Acidobacteriota bacterium]
MSPEKKLGTLVYFTESYPYGISEQWKKNEIEVFKKYFARIVVVPKSYAGNRTARNIVEGVEYLPPLFDEKVDRGTIQKLSVFAAAGSIRKFVREAVTSGAMRSTTKLKRLLNHYYQVGLMRSNPVYRDLLETGNLPTTVFYYFWGIGSVDVIPLLSDFKPLKVCRFHGWDLYSERHAENYIPFQADLIRELDLVLPCSDFGNKYLYAKFPFAGAKIKTARLGTISHGTGRFSPDRTLKLVTCSSVSAVKRLSLLVKALAKLNIEVRWTHIGDGELMQSLRDEITELPKNVRTTLTGNIPSENVLDLYRTGTFDLLLNVSESEGVPVSIMESFSASIPVYATDVGGTSEIVDDSVGKLLPADIGPEMLARELLGFFELPDDAKLRMREAAFARYESMCNAYINAEELAQLLIGRRDNG